MAYIVCEKSTVLTFISGCLLYKQEIVFFFFSLSLLTSRRKCGRARGERDTRDFVRVKQIKSEKWGAVRKRETVKEILGPDISLVCRRAEYILSILCIWALVSERHPLWYYPPPKADSLSSFSWSSCFQNPRLPSTYSSLPLFEHLRAESKILKWRGTEGVAARHFCPDRAKCVSGAHVAYYRHCAVRNQKSNMVSVTCTVAVLSNLM